jgi:hypothetical protein
MPCIFHIFGWNYAPTKTLKIRTIDVSARPPRRSRREHASFRVGLARRLPRRRAATAAQASMFAASCWRSRCARRPARSASRKPSTATSRRSSTPRHRSPACRFFNRADLGRPGTKQTADNPANHTRHRLEKAVRIPYASSSTSTNGFSLSRRSSQSVRSGWGESSHSFSNFSYKGSFLGSISAAFSASA